MTKHKLFHKLFHHKKHHLTSDDLAGVKDVLDAYPVWNLEMGGMLDDDDDEKEDKDDNDFDDENW